MINNNINLQEIKNELDKLDIRSRLLPENSGYIYPGLEIFKNQLYLFVSKINIMYYTTYTDDIPYKIIYYNNKQTCISEILRWYYESY